MVVVVAAVVVVIVAIGGGGGGGGGGEQRLTSASYSLFSSCDVGVVVVYSLSIYLSCGGWCVCFPDLSVSLPNNNGLCPMMQWAIRSATTEAICNLPNGIGIVKLMGRSAG